MTCISVFKNLGTEEFSLVHVFNSAFEGCMDNDNNTGMYSTVF